jgi:NADH:ubiquinone oxidoreductase subunit 4 (subunit M)
MSYVIVCSILGCRGVWSFIVILWIIHGVSSMYLFWFLGVLYNVIFSKSLFFIIYIKEVRGKFIFLLFWMVLAVISILPCSSFFSEIYVLMLYVNVFYLNVFVILLIFFMSIFYILYFYSVIALGWGNGWNVLILGLVNVMSGCYYMLSVVFFMLLLFK